MADVTSVSPVRSYLIVLVALMALYALTLENGAVLSDGARFVHEAFHDGRHFIGVPCH